MDLSPQLIGTIGILLLFFLMFMRIPVAFSMVFIGFIGFWFVSGLKPSLNIMGSTYYHELGKSSFTAVPLFVFMGYLTFYTGIVTKLFETSSKWIGHVPGGLVQATIVGGAGFGAISGSGTASTATLARIAIPEMIKSGVDKRLAYGTVASVGPLASLIPPSVLMIVVAIATEQSIGKMLIGGLLPGILAAVVYMGLVFILVKRNPAISTPIAKSTWKERFTSLKQIGSFAFLVFFIVAGLYTGKFTPTESGAIGAFVVFIMFLIKHKLNVKMLQDALTQTIKTTSVIFLIIASSFIFSYFLTVTRIPAILSDFLVNLPVAPIIILIAIVFMYLIVGMFMDMIAAMFITLPIIFPAIVSLGFDPIWFAVMVVFLAEVALVTPPFGLSLFIIKGTVPGSDLRDVYKGSYPFILADLVIIILLILFPQIVTLLPSFM
ncbi:MAG: TRAP transporter large permease [Neobacillus sp.]